MSAPAAPASKRFAEGFSEKADWRAACAEAASQARQRLGPVPCDLALVFVSELWDGFDPAELSRLLARELAPLKVLACNANGAISGRREAENTPAVSVLAMRLPGAGVHPFSFEQSELARFEKGADLVAALDLYPSDAPKFVVVGDPMTCDAEKAAALLREGYPGAPVVGGLSSGPVLRRPSWMLLGSQVLRSGLAGVALTGPVEVRTVVAQGCRPIGEPLTVTKADGNLLQELGGRNPLEVLRDMLSRCTPEDQRLARHALFAGLALDEKRGASRRGDYLVRNLLGFDQNSGALMIGAPLRRGQTLQFQLRDAQTSDQDFSALLGLMPEPDAAPRGALLVTCCGRGKGLYGEPDHDATLVQSLRGPVPMTGFFANGEFGCVDGKVFVHGYTSSLAVFS